MALKAAHLYPILALILISAAILMGGQAYVLYLLNAAGTQQTHTVPRPLALSVFALIFSVSSIIVSAVLMVLTSMHVSFSAITGSLEILLGLMGVITASVLGGFYGKNGGCAGSKQWLGPQQQTVNVCTIWTLDFVIAAIVAVEWIICVAVHAAISRHLKADNAHSVSTDSFSEPPQIQNQPYQSSQYASSSIIDPSYAASHPNALPEAPTPAEAVIPAVPTEAFVQDEYTRYGRVPAGKAAKYPSSQMSQSQVSMASLQPNYGKQQQMGVSHTSLQSQGPPVQMPPYPAAPHDASYRPIEDRPQVYQQMSPANNGVSYQQMAAAAPVLASSSSSAYQQPRPESQYQVGPPDQSSSSSSDNTYIGQYYHPQTAPTNPGRLLTPPQAPVLDTATPIQGRQQTPLEQQLEQHQVPSILMVGSPTTTTTIPSTIPSTGRLPENAGPDSLPSFTTPLEAHEIDASAAAANATATPMHAPQVRPASTFNPDMNASAWQPPQATGPYTRNPAPNRRKFSFERTD